MHYANPNALEHAVLKHMTSLAEGVQGMDKYSIREHYLILYADLRNNDTTVTFDVNENRNQFILSEPLNENDVFVGTRMGLFLHRVLLSNGVEVPGNTTRISYPDTNVFAGAAVAPSVVTEAGMLEMPYNGVLQIETNQKIRRKNYSTSQFRIVPETQVSATTQFGQEGASLVPLSQSIGFAGGDSNKIRLNMQGGEITSIAGVDTNVAINKAAIVIKGFVWVEGAIRATKAQLSKLINEF